MSLRKSTSLVLFVLLTALVTSCLPSRFLKDQFYRGSTPARRGNTGNTIYNLTKYEKDTFVSEGTERKKVQTAPRTGLWHFYMAAALQEAEDSNLPILLSFTGSDWSSHCQRLAENVYNQPEFVAFAQTEVVPVQLDYPKLTAVKPGLAGQNERMKTHFDVVAFPTIILLAPNGDYLTRFEYRDTSAKRLIKKFRSAIKKAR